MGQVNNYCRVWGAKAWAFLCSCEWTVKFSEKEPADSWVRHTATWQIYQLFHSWSRVAGSGILTPWLIYMITFSPGFVDVTFVTLFQKSLTSKTKQGLNPLLVGLNPVQILHLWSLPSSLPPEPSQHLLQRLKAKSYCAGPWTLALCLRLHPKPSTFHRKALLAGMAPRSFQHYWATESLARLLF